MANHIGGSGFNSAPPAEAGGAIAKRALPPDPPPSIAQNNADASPRTLFSASRNERDSSLSIRQPRR